MTAPRPLIDYGRMLDVIGIEGELMLGMAASALPSAAHAEVPGCPDFTLEETLRHVGSVHRVTRLWVRDGHRPQQWQRSPVDEDLIGFVRTGLSELLMELGRHDPAEPCDTWWPADRTHGFWRRRMAHETTMHRVDVEAAAGGPVHAIDQDVALDGIDELLFLWFGHRLGELRMSSPSRVRSRCPLRTGAGWRSSSRAAAPLGGSRRLTLGRRTRWCAEILRRSTSGAGGACPTSRSGFPVIRRLLHSSGRCCAQQRSEPIIGSGA